MEGHVSSPPYLYENEDGVHLRRVPDLVIHRNQFNMAREIIDTVSRHGSVDLSLDSRWDNLNLLLVGPTYADLRNQTKRDLANYLHHRHPRIGHLFTATYNIDSILQNVLNSNSLHTISFDDHSWVQQLKAHPYSWLHLYVHDEAHWGVGAGQGTDKWLQSLSACLEEISRNDPENRPPNVIILFVSATPDPISAVVRPLSEIGEQMVQWQKIPHSYQDIDRLPLLNDESRLKTVTTSAARSPMVAADYLWAMDQWIQRFGFENHSDPEGDTAQAFSGAGWATSATFEALKQVLPSEELDPELLSEDWNQRLLNFCCAATYQRNAANANMLVVRLSANEDVKKLVYGLKARFEWISQQCGKPFTPFEVISYVQGSNIASQLSRKARAWLRVGPNATLAIEQLEGLPCIVVVNALLTMGNRLPSNVTGWDVRVRYIGDVTRVKNTFTTWRQDVGRIAGHNKSAATIFVSLTDDTNVAGSSPGGVIRPADLHFPIRHSLLTGTGKATTANIEHHNNSQIIGRLGKFAVILKAVMQIGKTGAVLAFIDILYHENIVEAPEAAGDLASWTKLLAGIVNNPQHCNATARMQSLTDYWRNAGDFFARYHEAIASAEAVQAVSRTIVALITSALLPLVRTTNRHNPSRYTIMDAGCGMNGVFWYLSEHYQMPDNSDSMPEIPGILRVIGADLHPLIRQQTTAAEDQMKVHFRAHVGDMCLPQDTCEWLHDAHEVRHGCDFIVYSLSLFETDVTRHVQWAYENLAPTGTLYIADVVHRFPDTFRTSMLHQGFDQSLLHHAGMFQIRSFEKSTVRPRRDQSVELLPYNVNANQSSEVRPVANDWFC